MAAIAKKPLPINPRILSWAREWAGVSVERAAKKANVPVERIEAWEDEDSDDAPTVVQARGLAHLYDRSFLEFFFSQQPVLHEPKLIPDFRLHAHAHDPARDRDLRRIQQWAETQRVNALDLLSEIGEEADAFPKALSAATDDDAERVAESAREVLEFPVEEQARIPGADRDKLVQALRKKIERLNILTLRTSDLKKVGVRGFCLAEFPLPVIVISSESPRAQSFTLMHEFAHLTLKVSALSGYVTKKGGTADARRVEEWCNKFAAAFLMPATALSNMLVKPDRPAPAIPDATVRHIANAFSVSDHAALIRLVTLRYVDPEYYWDVKKPEFDDLEAHFKGGGKGKYYGTRYKNSLGDFYTTLVLQALGSGRITNHNAAEFMGIDNLQHLRDIRADYDM